jgi:hypothetical protein
VADGVVEKNKQMRGIIASNIKMTVPELKEVFPRAQLFRKVQSELAHGNEFYSSPNEKDFMKKELLGLQVDSVLKRNKLWLENVMLKRQMHN